MATSNETVKVFDIEARVTDSYADLEEKLNEYLGNATVLFIEKIGAKTPGDMRFLCIVKVKK